MTERKLKKRLQKEADRLMQAKKEKMLSFYQPTEETEEKPTGIRRFPVRALVTIGLAAILVGAVVFAVSFNGSAPEVDPPAHDVPPVAESQSEPASTAESEATSGSGPSAAFDIPPWVGEIRTPFAVAEIVEVTEETVMLYSRYNGYNTERYESTKVLCRILYSYRKEAFDLPFDYMGVEVSNYVPFEELQEIYVSSASVGGLKEHDRIFFQPTDMYGNGCVYYGPVTDMEGQAEYLPFIDGKIDVTGEALELASFLPIREVNEEVKHLLESADRGSTSELIDASPKFVFEGELDFAQVEAFFQGCKALSETFDRIFQGCCVVEDEG